MDMGQCMVNYSHSEQERRDNPVNLSPDWDYVELPPEKFETDKMASSYDRTIDYPMSSWNDVFSTVQK